MQIKSVYKYLVEELNTYGIVALGGAYKSHLNRLQLAQNNILKSKLNKNPFYHIEILRTEFDVIPIKKKN